MGVNLKDTVVVLGDPGTKRLDVGSFDSVTQHINDHVQAGQSPYAAGEPAGPGGPLRYFTGEGQKLNVAVNGGVYSLVRTDQSIKLKDLKSEVKAAVQQYAASPDKPLDGPPRVKLDRDWSTALGALADLVKSPPPGAAMLMNRGSWFHNFFVHSW